MVYQISRQEQANLLLGRYSIDRTLGNRLGRRTLLAYDHHQQMSVIIKYLPLDDPLQNFDLKRFEREVHLLKTLDHPALPRYIDSFKIDTANWRGMMLIQSYAEGQSLYQAIRTGRTFSETDLKDIAKQVLEILHYLHQQRTPIIHRDIKPSNLVLGHRSLQCPVKVYLVDLGLVQTTLTRSAAQPMTIAGYDGYRPPEQLGDLAIPASDLYSLAMTLIHLATHQHPSTLPQRGLKVVFAQHMGDFSRPFKQWLRWLSDPNISKRPRSALEAFEALHKMTDNFTQPAPRPFIPDFTGIVQHKIHHYQQVFESIKPSGTRLCLIEKPNSLEVVVPRTKRLQWRHRETKQAFIQSSLGVSGLSLLSYAIIQVLQGIAHSASFVIGGTTVALLVLLFSASVVSMLCAWQGLKSLAHQFLRELRIQLEPDILLVGYQSPLIPLEYRVNSRRQDIDDIDMRPDGASIRIFLNRNRTVSGQLNYHLQAHDLALNSQEMHWLSELLTFWLKRNRVQR
jgi:serine/threonine protein kinase